MTDIYLYHFQVHDMHDISSKKTDFDFPLQPLEHTECIPLMEGPIPGAYNQAFCKYLSQVIFVIYARIWIFLIWMDLRFDRRDTSQTDIELTSRFHIRLKCEQ